MTNANAASAAARREMLDRYELIALLARGGMGSVHLARLPGEGGFQRLYAIKVMHPHLAAEDEFVHMLLDEARIAARIHHPNAVPIVDVCRGARGFYLVMDYIDGVTLSRLVVATAKLPWRQRARAVVRVVLDALAGLHAAHEVTDDEGKPLGLVHRDVSPQNIMVGSDGVGRITDFGIALAASRIVSSRPGLIKGKPAYMAPEQVQAQQVDRRADVFAMGIVLWEALTGQRLFDAQLEAAALMQVLGAVIPAPSVVARDVPASLDAVCLKALERPVGNRWESARAMAAGLEAAAAAEGLLAPTHEVADLLASTFAEEFSDRRALIREHARATGSLGAPRVLTPLPREGVEVSKTIQVPAASDSKSIPAIEVPSTPPEEPSLAETMPATRRSRIPGFVTNQRRPWMLPAAGLGVAALAVGAVLALRSPAPTPDDARPASGAPREPAAPPPVAAVVPEAVPPAPPPAAPPVEPPALTAPAVPSAPAEAPATRRDGHRTRDGRRTAVDGGAAAAATSPPATAPSQPAIEANPYLRR